jgi:hypothetical protein
MKFITFLVFVVLVLAGIVLTHQRTCDGVVVEGGFLGDCKNTNKDLNI